MRLARFRPVVLPRAMADVDGIGDYLTKESPDGAAKLIARILTAVDSLRRLPLRHKVYEARKSPELSVRMVPAGSYLIYYRVDTAAREVRVLRVIHGARRQPKRFR